MRRLGALADRMARACVPDPFVFATLLTFLTLLLGVVLTRQSIPAMVGYWSRGLWDLLEFGMQMALILVTGHALAESPPVRAAIGALARRPRTPRGAVALVAVVACGAALVNWGLGLVAGALLAREVGVHAARRGIRAHYPLLAAAGYSALMVWHGGLSGSAPLAVATSGHFLEDRIGVIPIGATLFSPANLVCSLGLLILVPVVCCVLAPKEGAMPPPAHILRAAEARAAVGPAARPSGPRSFAARLDDSVLLATGLALLGFAGSAVMARAEWQRTGTFNLTLNLVNLFMLSLGLLLHRRPSSYLAAASEAARGTAGIILQFPFYAGIMGMMRHSGLVALASSWFVSVSGPRTFPVLAFFSAAVVNQFVPSGGAQWAVQGPILVDAAQGLGASMPKTILALAYGDEWTNMTQPFWALPILAIVGLEARDILGYTMAIMLLCGAWYVLALAVFPA